MILGALPSTHMWVEGGGVGEDIILRSQWSAEVPTICRCDVDARV